jgi:hypothetical protein
MRGCTTTLSTPCGSRTAGSGRTAACRGNRRRFPRRGSRCTVWRVRGVAGASPRERQARAALDPRHAVLRADEQVRIAGTNRVRQRAGSARAEAIHTLADAAAFLADWYGFAYFVLEWLRAGLESTETSRVQLWPEHFDAAFDAFAGRRARNLRRLPRRRRDRPAIPVSASRRLRRRSADRRLEWPMPSTAPSCRWTTSPARRITERRP